MPKRSFNVRGGIETGVLKIAHCALLINMTHNTQEEITSSNHRDRNMDMRQIVLVAS